jgi:hypothetical protein
MRARRTTVVHARAKDTETLNGGGECPVARMPGLRFRMTSTSEVKPYEKVHVTQTREAAQPERLTRIPLRA